MIPTKILLRSLVIKWESKTMFSNNYIWTIFGTQKYFPVKPYHNKKKKTLYSAPICSAAIDTLARAKSSSCIKFQEESCAQSRVRIDS